MIQSNELRIGNFIDIGQVTSMSIKTINVTHKNWLFTFDYSEIKPIPLTEEWLLKFGFKKHIGWDDMEFYCLLNDGGNADRFELMETNQGYELPSGKICKFVHQLQNCYFFHELSGTELTLIN